MAEHQGESPAENEPIGRAKGGRARADKLSPEKRKAIASAAASVRWKKAKEKSEEPIASSGEAAGNHEQSIPRATHWGELQIGDATLPCYVLDTPDPIRVFSLKGAVSGLIGTEGGQLAEYIKVKSLRPFLPVDLIPADEEDGQKDRIPALIRFDAGGDNPHPMFRYPWGLPVESFMDLCDAYSRAAEFGELTEKQKLISKNANAFLRACRNIGITALVDEATGYQTVRPLDDLQFKLKLFLSEELRKWEKTFPDDLWIEFGRLTGWKGPTHSRPKYWGKLVMELIYEYLDPDVAQWLKENKPKPVHGQNYHQWMTSQYGLKRLIEHTNRVIGLASSCETMEELRYKMQEKYGVKRGFQFSFKLLGQGGSNNIR